MVMTDSLLTLPSGRGSESALGALDQPSRDRKGARGIEIHF